MIVKFTIILTFNGILWMESFGSPFYLDVLVSTNWWKSSIYFQLNCFFLWKCGYFVMTIYCVVDFGFYNLVCLLVLLLIHKNKYAKHKYQYLINLPLLSCIVVALKKEATTSSLLLHGDRVLFVISVNHER